MRVVGQGCSRRSRHCRATTRCGRYAWYWGYTGLGSSWDEQQRIRQKTLDRCLRRTSFLFCIKNTTKLGFVCSPSFCFRLRVGGILLSTNICRTRPVKEKEQRCNTVSKPLGLSRAQGQVRSCLSHQFAGMMPLVWYLLFSLAIHSLFQTHTQPQAACCVSAGESVR